MPSKRRWLTWVLPLLAFLSLARPAAAVCGDSSLDSGEDCDDGNVQDFDGCSSSCQFEVGWDCTGIPSVCVNQAQEVISLESARMGTCALFANRRFRCWGSNRYNMFGYYDNPYVGVTPGSMTKIPYLDFPVSTYNYTVLSAAASNNLGGCSLWAVGAVNKTMCWGHHHFTGTQGTTVGDHYRPLKTTGEFVDTGTYQLVSIAVSHFNTLALTVNGKVLRWGREYYGQLAKAVPDENYIGGSIAESVTAHGHIIFADTIPVTRVYASQFSHFALFANGRLRCWGRNLRGVCGQGHADIIGDDAGEIAVQPYITFNDTFPVVDLSNSNTHAMALFGNGKVRGWGRLDYGAAGEHMDELPYGSACGDAPGEIETMPYIRLTETWPVIEIHTGLWLSGVVFDVNGEKKLKLWGYNGYYNTLRPGPHFKAYNVSGPYDMPLINFWHTYPLKQVSLSKFGYEHCVMFDNVPIGSGNLTSNAACWGRRALSIRGDERYVGSNHAGNLEFVKPFNDTAPIIHIEHGSRVVCGTFATSSGNKVRCWGMAITDQALGWVGYKKRGFGAMEIANLQESPRYQDKPVSRIIPDTYYALVQMADGKLEHMGYGAHGPTPIWGHIGYDLSRLSYNSWASFETTVPVMQILPGTYASYALFGNGKLKSWGRNLYGATGHQGIEYIGAHPSSTYRISNVPYLEFKDTVPIIQIAVHREACCVLRVGGTLICFGRNNYGDLALGHLDHVGYDGAITVTDLDPITFSTPDPAVKVWGGHHLTFCALFDLGGGVHKSRCWGYNQYGTLGYDDAVDRGGDPTDIPNLPFHVFGTTHYPVQMAMGLYGSCAIFNNNGVRCWGYANNQRISGVGNNLAYGYNAPISDLAFIQFNSTHIPTKIVIGDYHACALFNNRRVRCWGGNIHATTGGETAATWLGRYPSDLPNLDFLDFRGTTAAATSTIGAQPNFTTPIHQVSPLEVWTEDLHGVTIHSNFPFAQPGDRYEFKLMPSTCTGTPTEEVPSSGDALQRNVFFTSSVPGDYMLCYARVGMTGVLQPLTAPLLVVARIRLSWSAPINEHSLVVSTVDLVIDLDGATFAATVTNGHADALTVVNGLQQWPGDTGEARGFITLVKPVLTATSLTRMSGTQVKIAIPVTSNYMLFAGDDRLALQVPGSLLVGSETARSRVPLVITDLSIAHAYPDGYSNPVPETALSTFSGNSVMISLTGDEFIPSVTNGNADALTLIQTMSGGSDVFGWKLHCRPLLTAASLARLNSSTVVVSLVNCPEYRLVSGDETVTMTIPTTLVTGPKAIICNDPILVAQDMASPNIVVLVGPVASMVAGTVHSPVLTGFGLHNGDGFKIVRPDEPCNNTGMVVAIDEAQSTNPTSVTVPYLAVPATPGVYQICYVPKMSNNVTMPIHQNTGYVYVNHPIAWGIQAASPSALQEATPGTTVRLDVALWAPLDPGVTVTTDVSIAETADATVTPASLSWNSGNWNINQTVTVTVMNDDYEDGSTYLVHVTFPNFVATGAPYSVSTPVPLPVTVIDDDVASVYFAPPATVVENSGVFNPVVRLGSKPLAPVSITWFAGLSNVTGNLDCSATTTPFILDASNWNTGVAVDCTTVDNILAEGPITVHQGMQATSGDAYYNGLQMAGIITITDDENTNLVFTHSKPLAEGNTSIILHYRLAHKPVSDVTYTVTSTWPTLTVISPDRTFTTLNWNIGQALEVRVDQDEVMSGSPTYSVPLSFTPTAGSDLNYRLNGPQTHSFLVQEDDLVPNFVLLPVAPVKAGDPPASFPNWLTVTRNLSDVTAAEISMCGPGPAWTTPPAYTWNPVTGLASLSFHASAASAGTCIAQARLKYSNGVFTAYQSTDLSVGLYPAPAIASIDPATGPIEGNSVVTIKGSYFGRSQTDLVAVGVGPGTSLPCKTVTWISASEVHCVTPAGDPVTQIGVALDVYVQTVHDPAVARVALWKYTLSPAVTGVDPVYKVSDKKDVRLQIVGARFVTAGLKVTVAGFDCGNIDLQSESQLLCDAPVSPTAKQGPVMVETSSGVSGDAVRFYLTQPPIVTSSVPSEISYDLHGASSTVVLIKGDNLGTGAADDILTVTVAGVQCTTVKHVSPQELECALPPAPRPQKGSIIVDSTFGGKNDDSSSSSFEFLLLHPRVASFTPTAVIVNFDTNVTISGAHFGGTSADLKGVTLAGAPCDTLDLVNAGTIVCVFARDVTLTPRLGHVVVNTVKGSNHSSSDIALVLRELTPIVRGMTPVSGLVTGGSTVTLTGDNLAPTPFSIVNLTFGPYPAEVWSPITTTAITVVSPVAVIDGQVQVNVETTEGGPGISNKHYLYLLPQPVGTRGHPRVASRQVPTDITLIGQYFGRVGNVTLTATVGGQPCTKTVHISPEVLVCTANPGTVDNPTFTVTRDDQTSAPFQIGLVYLSEDQICRPACPQHADCVNARCVCVKGFVGNDCNTPAIDILETDTVSTEDGGQTRLQVRLAAKPTAAVTIYPSLSNSKEAKLMETSIVIKPEAFDVYNDIHATGINDHVRDGTQTYTLTLNTSSSDTVFDGIISRAVALRNLDSMPKVTSVTPDISAHNGTNITIRFEDVDASLFVRIDQTVYGMANFTAIHRLTKQSPQNGTAPVALLQAATTATESPVLAVELLTPQSPTPPVDRFVELEIRNSGGTSTLYKENLFYTDDCPEKGSFGRGNDCQQCPSCAQCPGGYNIIPEPQCAGGLDPVTGRLVAIRRCEPPEKCLGENLCAPGYEGMYCDRCSIGYSKEAKLCIPCPPEEGRVVLIMCDMVVWGTLSLAGALIETDENYSHVIQFILALQTMAGVGQLVASRLASWIRTIYGFMHLFSGDIQFLKPDCQGHINLELEYGIRLTYNAFLTASLFVTLFVVSRLSIWWNRRKNGDEDAEARRLHFRRRAIRCVMIYLTLMYLTVTTSSLRMVACVDIGGGDYRSSYDRTHTCFDHTTHIIAFVAAMILLIFYTLGFPIYMAVLQRRHADRLVIDETFKAKYNFLQEPYKEKHSFFWISEFLLAVALALGDSVLLDHLEAQFSISISVVVVILVYNCVFMPFHRRWENIVMIMITVANLLGLTLIYLIKANMLDFQHEKIIAYCLGALIVVSTCVFASVLVYFLVYKRVPRQPFADAYRRDNVAEQYDGWFKELHADIQAEKQFAKLREEELLQLQREQELRRKSSIFAPALGTLDHLLTAPAEDQGVKDAFTVLEAGEKKDIDTFDAATAAGAAAVEMAVSTPEDTVSNESMHALLPTPGTVRGESSLQDINISTTDLASLESNESNEHVNRERPRKKRMADDVEVVVPVTLTSKTTSLFSTALSFLSRPEPRPIPNYWTHDDPFVSMTVNASSAEIQAIQALVQATFKSEYVGQGVDNPNLTHKSITITKVERNENGPLWQHFATIGHLTEQRYSKREVPPVAVATDGDWSQGNNPKGPINYVYLFHGTDPSNLDLIKEHSFDERVARDGMFGHGIYFAENSSKADEYCKEDTDGSCHMVLSRVILGVPFITLKSLPGMRRPPCMLGHVKPCIHPRFDAVIAETTHSYPEAVLKKYRELILYDRYMCYPEYFITYKRDPSPSGGS